MSLPRVKLCPIESDDLKVMREVRNDPRVYEWCRQFEPISKEHHEAWFDSLPGRTDVRMYSIRDEGNVWIGACGLTSIDYINSRAEFSLYIHPTHQGGGNGEAALRVLVEHGFDVLNLNCIWGESFDGNPAVKMFQRVGFKMEGTRRDFYYRKGEFIDAHLFSLLRSEYV